jgi:hypothetical protein
LSLPKKVSNINIWGQVKLLNYLAVISDLACLNQLKELINVHRYICLLLWIEIGVVLIWIKLCHCRLHLSYQLIILRCSESQIKYTIRIRFRCLWLKITCSHYIASLSLILVVNIRLLIARCIVQWILLHLWNCLVSIIKVWVLR